VLLQRTLRRKFEDTLTLYQSDEDYEALSSSNIETLLVEPLELLADLKLSPGSLAPTGVDTIQSFPYEEPDDEYGKDKWDGYPEGQVSDKGQHRQHEVHKHKE
jgi:hypothetical protein